VTVSVIVTPPLEETVLPFPDYSSGQAGVCGGCLYFMIRGKKEYNDEWVKICFSYFLPGALPLVSRFH